MLTKEMTKTGNKSGELREKRIVIEEISKEKKIVKGRTKGRILEEEEEKGQGIVDRFGEFKNRLKSETVVQDTNNEKEADFCKGGEEITGTCVKAENEKENQKGSSNIELLMNGPIICN